ncbi:hypothetical protein [Pannonibacter carbonis]|uniref:hypothetical protein n=1 Tax=Pannonibacter carbonis TaxID=2067569 RepID=UPI0013004EB2|nr:hypothetical protein [Pannonibacter carbonis]
MIIALAIIQSTLAATLFLRNPTNIAAIISFLTSIFFIFPAVLFLEGGIMISYSWRNFERFSDILTSSEINEYAYALCVAVSLLFTIGATLAQYRSQRASPTNDTPTHMIAGFKSVSKRRISTAYILLFSIWLLGAIYYYYLSGFSISKFLLPIVDRNAEKAPGYIKLFYLAIPPVLYALAYWRNGRIGSLSLFSIAICAVSVFSSHQRREAVTMLLFISFLPILVERTLLGLKSASLDERKSLAAKSARGARAKAFLFLSTGLALVPLLWYTRVNLTAASEGNTNFSAIDHRSILDVVFGSPATGFPTLLTISKYVDSVGINPFYLFEFIIAAPIPRTLWTNKPIDLDSSLQNYYALMENPSSFWIGELYYMQGISSVLFASLLGYGMFRIHFILSRSLNLYHRTLATLILMQSLTLFKNGFAVTALNLIFIGGLLTISWKFCLTRTK